MSGNKHAGFTLFEMVMAIMVIGIALGGVLMAFNTTVKSSADPMVRKQMLSLAEGMLEEILLKPYVPGAGTGTINAVTCSRAEADDISDYHGYGTNADCGQPRDLSGNVIPNLTEYRIAVAVNTGASLGGLATDVARITVTVTHGGESFALVGYRTNFASLGP